ncbi:hypothetical protein K438DRAFT_1781649 [Mycena galopus ATCC 62051]|nr:hypothetical protein K438DRAFT_1781649 [Mycena galopus ATCC 62051]
MLYDGLHSWRANKASNESAQMRLNDVNDLEKREWVTHHRRPWAFEPPAQSNANAVVQANGRGKHSSSDGGHSMNYFTKRCNDTSAYKSEQHEGRKDDDLRGAETRVRTTSSEKPRQKYSEEHGVIQKLGIWPRQPQSSLNRVAQRRVHATPCAAKCTKGWSNRPDSASLCISATPARPRRRSNGALSGLIRPATTVHYARVTSYGAEIDSSPFARRNSRGSKPMAHKRAGAQGLNDGIIIQSAIDRVDSTGGHKKCGQRVWRDRDAEWSQGRNNYPCPATYFVPWSPVPVIVEFCDGIKFHRAGWSTSLVFCPPSKDLWDKETQTLFWCVARRLEPGPAGTIRGDEKPQTFPLGGGQKVLCGTSIAILRRSWYK